MKLKVGDKVKVISGDHKGKTGKVLKINKITCRALVENVNLIKKHVKPNGQNETGGILEVEAPIHVSNLKVITDAKEEKATKTKKVTKTVEAETKTVKAPKKTTKTESK